MKVIWTEHAYRQLDEAMAYIAQDRLETAAIWLEKILEKYAELSTLPDRGRIVPEISREDIREVQISPYRLIYKRGIDEVIITMVLHDRQLLNQDKSG